MFIRPPFHGLLSHLAYRFYGSAVCVYSTTIPRIIESSGLSIPRICSMCLFDHHSTDYWVIWPIDSTDLQYVFIRPPFHGLLSHLAYRFHGSAVCVYSTTSPSAESGASSILSWVSLEISFFLPVCQVKAKELNLTNYFPVTVGEEIDSRVSQRINA